MNPYLEAKYPLRACDFDLYKRLQPSSVLDLFQDAAGRHSVELGVGIARLMEEEKHWIVSSLFYEVVKTPEMYREVRVRTWPRTPSMVAFPRDYEVLDEDGTLLVKGTSQWAVIDGGSRKILPAKGVYPEELICLEEKAFSKKMPRLRDFEPAGQGMRVVPTFSMLDCNGHVNNTKYANFVMDALCLPKETPIRTFQMNYRKELLLNVPVWVYTQYEDGVYTAMGKNEQGETMFHCQITV